MNQQLLNINTVISHSNMAPASGMAPGHMETENNNPLRLEKITTIVNNVNNTNTNALDTNTHMKYKIIRYLGSGIRGNLYLAVDSTGRRVICKEIQLDTDPTNNAIQTQQLEFELNILKYLSSNGVAREHVNPCLDYKIHDNYVYTIFPVFRGYSLGHFNRYMRKLPSTADYYKIARFLIKSLLHALAKIHDTGIAHQNITENAVLVSTFNEPREIKVKFTDFGLGCGCPKQSQELTNPLGETDEGMIPWRQYDFFSKIGNCRENGHAPVKYVKEVLERLKDSDYLKIAQRYDVLCLGLIIIKYLLPFDVEIQAIINNLLVVGVNNRQMEVLRDMIKNKYLDGKEYFAVSFSSEDKKMLLEYLKMICKYMISSTPARKPAQYVIDKIIIYEKYKNDIF